MTAELLNFYVRYLCACVSFRVFIYLMDIYKQQRKLRTKAVKCGKGEGKTYLEAVPCGENCSLLYRSLFAQKTCLKYVRSFSNTLYISVVPFVYVMRTIRQGITMRNCERGWRHLTFQAVLRCTKRYGWYAAAGSRCSNPGVGTSVMKLS
jgi:hypothetical protein